MVRNIVLYISSQHSDPTQVAWIVRETAWTPQKRRESVMCAGTFTTPAGGERAVLGAALTEVQAALAVPRCGCGKPADHLGLDPADPDWSCRAGH